MRGQALALLALALIVSSPAVVQAGTMVISKATKEAHIEERFDFANGLYTRNMYGMALEEYDKIIHEFPGYSKIALVRFRAAESLFLSEEFESALKRYQDFVRDYPERLEAEIAHSRIGESFYQLGQSEEAFRFFKPLYRSASPRTRHVARYYSGKICFDKGSYKAASVHFKVVSGPEDGNTFWPLANFYLGEIALNANDPGTAIAHFKISLESKDDEIMQLARFGLGKAFFLNGDFADAQPIFEALSRDPKLPELAEDAFINYIDTLYNLADDEALIDTYKARVDQIMKPKTRTDAQFLAAASYARLGRHGDAIGLYDTIQHDKNVTPEDRERSGLRKVEALMDMDSFKSALKTLDELSNANVKAMDQVHYLRATALNHFERREEAIQELETLIAEYPDSVYVPEALLNQGYLFFETEALEKAAMHFQTFIDQYPEHELITKTLSDLILLYVKAKQFDMAIKNSQVFLERFPDYAGVQTVHERLAALYGETKEFEKAIETYRKHLELFELNEKDLNRIQFLIGYNYGLQEKFKEAVEAYQLVRKGMAAEDIYYAMLKNRAYCHIRQDAYKQAAADYHAIITSFPENDIDAKVFFWLANYHLKAKDPAQIRRVVNYLNTRTDAVKFKGETEYFAAESYQLDQNLESAVESYARSIEAGGPFQADAYLGQARCYVQLKDIESAKASFKEALRQVGDHYDLAMKIRKEQADFLASQGEPLEAAKGYLAIAILYDDPEVIPEVLYVAGQAFEAAEELAQAIQVYEELLERFPQSSFATQAEERLQVMQT